MGDKAKEYLLRISTRSKKNTDADTDGLRSHE